MTESETRPAVRDLSVIVPFFEEAGNVAPLCRELGEVLGPLGLDYELLFVDDGSADGTFDALVARAAGDPRSRVIRLAGRQGQTAALQAGFDHARGRILVTLDGDRQNDPADIPRLLAKLDEGYDAVVGWRRRRHDPLLHRRLPSWLANRLIRRLTGQRFRDLGCASRAFRRDAVRRLRLTSELHRFLPVMMALDGARCTEIEVSHRPRTWGRSKYGLARTWQVLLDLALTILLARRRELEDEGDRPATGSWTRELVDRLAGSTHRPLRRFGGIGLVLGALALLLGVAAIPASARPTLFAATLVASGLLGLAAVASLALGFFAEMSRARQRRAPPYRIESVFEMEDAA